jgi:hypothetical protein
MDINIFYDKGSLNKNKLREQWVQKNLSFFYKKLKDFQIANNQNNLKFSQVIYNYVNNISDIPLCKECSINEQRFLGFSSGYNEFCSKKCACKNSLPKAIENRKLNTLEKYGVEHTSKLDFVKDKQKKTNIEKYGFVSPTLNLEILEKQKNTMLQKYNVEYSGESSTLLQKSLDTRFNQYKNKTIELYTGLNIVNIEKEGEVRILCDRCNNEYDIKTPLLRLRHLRYNVIPCLNCNPLSSYKFTSQNEIYDELKDYFEIERGNRKILNGKELDLYIESKNIAIEFNGIYWHSDLYKEKKYHLDKKENCEKLNINLIHIWEDNWLYKKEITLSRIKNALGITSEKIMARKCIIKKVENVEAKDFLDANHLQGHINSSYKIGLYYNDELVSLMTFGKLRSALGSKGKDGFYELYRFASKINTNVVGAFSKLLKRFEDEIKPIELVTYANRDWSFIDNVYLKNGFEFIHNTEVNYWYYDKYLNKTHRFNFRKKLLVEKGFDKDKTESVIMSELDFMKVYDCGSKKYSKKY